MKSKFTTILFALGFLALGYFIHHCLELCLSNTLNLFTMLILFLTLLETRTQRITSYKPKLTFSPRSFYLQCTKNGIPAIWKLLPNDFYGDSQSVRGLENTCRLEMTNVGLGPALKIKIDFDFDKSKICKELGDYSKKHPKLLKFDSQTKSIQIYSKSKTSHTSSIEYQLFQEDENYKNKISALLPFSTNQVFNITLPKSYVMYLTILAFLSAEEEEQESFKCNIPLIVKLKYDDTGSERYGVSIKLDFTFLKFDGLISIDCKGFETSSNFARCDCHAIEVWRL